MSFEQRHKRILKPASVQPSMKETLSFKMLQKAPQNKPTIAIKPSNIPKPLYLIGPKSGEAIKEDQKSASPDCKNGAIKKYQKNSNNFTSILSSPSIGNCPKDCCGILNKQLLEQQQQVHHSPQCSVSNGNGNSDHGINGLEKILKSPTDSKNSSIDSSLSSSSGGFKDADFLTKTKLVYELYDKEDNLMQKHNQSNENLSQIDQNQSNQSKIHEIQSRLIAQQQQQLGQQQNDSMIAPKQPQNIQQLSQYKNSSKQLEQVLAQRFDKETRLKPILSSANMTEKGTKRLSQVSFEEAQTNVGAALAGNFSKKIQQKLQEEMKQQCQIIKDKYLIEKVPVQEHYKEFLVK